MPLNLPDDLPKNFPNPNYLTLGNFKKGVISLLDRSRLPKDALEQADNIFLVEDGQPTLRPGVDWYGTASPNSEPWDGMDYFDYGGVIHLVGVANGTVYRSVDNGDNWTACTGYTLTADLPVQMLQYNDYLYLTNGTDHITLYDGSTTLSRYTSLTTPTAPSAAETALAGTGYKYYYKVARVSDIGYSVASPVNTGTVESSLGRTSWVAGTNYVTLTTPTGIAGQVRWDIYLSTDDVNYYYLASTAATNGVASTYVDTGTAVVVPTATAPDTNTSEGPLVKELKAVGSRMYGIRDTVNRYRMWFSTGSLPYGLFAGDDGGYLDWALGGKYIPMQVEDYRDGKGTPLATVWCDSADGQGCILQMSLDSVTFGDVTVIIPSAYKLPGSRGTPAPGSVINVLNDYMFYNSQAFYNLGSRINFQNLLSTDESSGNIRPSVKQINNAAVEGICSAYSDAKVYFSVPYGSTTNNATIVYDTERKAWLPYAFTLGFKKFLKYTDTDGNHRLLALKPGDNRLTEISMSIKGDYGVAFESVLMTGLYNTTKNRFEFQWTEEAEMEFSNPAGTIIVELLGLERSRGFRTQASANIVGGSSATSGWDSFSFDSTPWDDTSTAVEAYAESSVKKYFRLGKELNAVQWRITTNSLDANYILRTLQTWGTDTAGGKPRSWRITRT
jgi:hypothetical protein